jgi:hypothetical protein
MRYDDFNILKGNREAPNSVESDNRYLVYWPRCDSLVGYCLELRWSINESLADLVCQLCYNDKVTSTATKAHRGLERSTIVAT